MTRFEKALAHIPKIAGAFGGRKTTLGLYASALMTAMAFPLKATFGEYALAICGALGLTSAAIAWEDVRKVGK